MSLLRSLFPGLRSLFRKEQVNKELDEELNGFLEMAAEEKMKQGMSRREALRAVRLERGSLEVTKEVVRSAGWESFVETCWQDVRFGLRTLRKSPGFTTIAILTLALGIGANTAIFTMTNGLMLRTLSVQDPGRLVELLHQYPGEPAFNGFSWDAYQTIRDGNHVFSDLIVGGMNFLTIRGDKLQPQTVFGGGVGGTFSKCLECDPPLAA
jgi:hypothetical protein